MCDDRTEAENQAYVERLRLSRRDLGIGAGTAFAAMLTGCASAASHAAATTPAMPAGSGALPPVDPGEGSTQDGAASASSTASRMVSIETPDGTAEGFFVVLKGGPHPGVLVWPDVAGLRDAYMKMATRLATEGYAVLVVNPYYRSSKLPILRTFSEWRTDAGREKIRPMTEALTPEGVARDGAAFVAWLDAQAEVDRNKKLATTGYCMGGPFTFRTAAAAAERVGVIGSFHGGGLVTDAPTSPHRSFSKMKAAALICIAQNDDARQPDAKGALEQAARDAGVPAEIEVYPAQHGWCAIDSPVYDEGQAERAWGRMLATFASHL